MAERLFIYGTLHPDLAPGEIREVVRKLKPLGKGRVRGTLYHFGEYPGLVRKGTGPQWVDGEVFMLPSESGTLAKLDAYEEYRPTDPSGSLFKRSKMMVTRPDGSKQSCWVYVYNQSVQRVT